MIAPQYRPIQRYQGYFQEARTYLTYPFLPKRNTRHKFVILSMHRSGSSLLVSLLDSHPFIHCEGELLFYRKFFPIRYVETRSRLSPKISFGFKLMPNHIGYQGYRDAVQVMADLHNLGYRIIKLRRRNLLNATISLIFAQKSGKYHYKNSERAHGLPRLSIEPAEVIEKLDWFERLSALQEQITQDIPHLELIYEDHLIHSTGHQATVDKIVDYIGVERAPVHSDFERIGLESTIESIANFKEISESLRGSKAAQYLQE